MKVTDTDVDAIAHYEYVSGYVMKAGDLIF